MSDFKNKVIELQWLMLDFVIVLDAGEIDEDVVKYDVKELLEHFLETM